MDRRRTGLSPTNSLYRSSALKTVEFQVKKRRGAKRVSNCRRKGREREGVCQLRPVGQKPEQAWEKEEGKINLYRFIVQSEAFLLFFHRSLHLELFGPLHLYQLVPLERALSGIRWWSVIPHFFEDNSQVPYFFEDNSQVELCAFAKTAADPWPNVCTLVCSS